MTEGGGGGMGWGGVSELVWPIANFKSRRAGYESVYYGKNNT